MSADDPSPQALVSAARDLIRVHDTRTAGMWPRASALLGRQAVELSMTRLWTAVAPGLHSASPRCQLLCLRELLGDRHLARRVSAAWSGLSRASHHRIYELPPTAGELSAWLECAGEFAEAVERG